MMENAPQPECIRKDVFGNCLPVHNPTMKVHKGFYSHRVIGVDEDPFAPKRPKSERPGGPAGNDTPVPPAPGPSPSPSNPSYVHPKNDYAFTHRKDAYLGYYSYDTQRRPPSVKSTVPLDVQEKAMDFQRFYTKMDVRTKIRKKVRLGRQHVVKNLDPEVGKSRFYGTAAEDAAKEKRQQYIDKTNREVKALETLHDNLHKGDIFQNHRKALRTRQSSGVGLDYETPVAAGNVKIGDKSVHLSNFHVEVNTEGDVVHVNIPGQMSDFQEDINISQLIAQDTKAAIQQIKEGNARILSGNDNTRGEIMGFTPEEHGRGIRYKAIVQAIDDAVSSHGNISQIDIAGHSTGGFWSRLLTSDIAEKYPQIKVKGMGLNAFVRDSKGLPDLNKTPNAEFKYHDIYNDPVNLINGFFLRDEAQKGAQTHFYPESADPGKFTGKSLMKNVSRDLPLSENVKTLKGNLGDQLLRRHHDTSQFTDARVKPSAGNVDQIPDLPSDMDVRYTPKITEAPVPDHPLNRELPVRTRPVVDSSGNPTGDVQLENFQPTVRENISSLHSLKTKFPKAAAAGEFTAELGYGAAAGYLGGKIVEAIDPNRQKKVASAAKAATQDFEKGDIVEGLKETGKMAGQEAIHAGEYAGAVGAIDAAGRALFSGAKVAYIGGGAEAAAGAGASTAAAAFLPAAAAVGGGMVVSEATKAGLEYGAKKLGIDEKYAEPTSEIAADAAGGAAGVAIAGYVASAMGVGAAAGPMGLAVGAGVGAAIGAGLELYKHWDDVSNFVGHLF